MQSAAERHFFALNSFVLWLGSAASARPRFAAAELPRAAGPAPGGFGEPEGVRGTSGTEGSVPRTLQLEFGCARGDRVITSCGLAWEGFQQRLLMALLLGGRRKVCLLTEIKAAAQQGSQTLSV